MSTSVKRQIKNRLADGRQHIALKASDLYHSNADEAQRLWDEGYRPLEAYDLEVGDTVLSRSTMFDVAFGPINALTIVTITKTSADCSVRIETATTFVETDDGAEVWMKERSCGRP